MRKLKKALLSRATVTAICLAIQFFLVFLVQIRFSRTFVFYYFISAVFAVALGIKNSKTRISRYSKITQK